MSLRGKLLMAAAIVPLALFSIADTIANVVVGANPALAHRVAGWDGRASAADAAFRFSIAPTGATDSPVAREAQAAIRSDPTALEALNVLGAQAQLRQDRTRAQKIFGHELALSRRELPARLWAIEEAANRGDVSAAIKNYDIALRTSAKAREVLFPILASAIAEPRIRAELRRRWRSRPGWAADFIADAAANGSSPTALVALLDEVEGIGITAGSADRLALVNNLVNRQQSGAAWRYYASFSKGARADRSRDPRFRADPAKASVFDWSVTEFAAIQTVAGGSGVVELAVPPATSGPLLQQLQILPPGRYRLSSVSSGIDQPATAVPNWEIRCASGQLIGSGSVLPSAEGQRRSTRVDFTVPVGCATQFLTLFARSTDAINGVTGRIEEAQIAPL